MHSLSLLLYSLLIAVGVGYMVSGIFYRRRAILLYKAAGKAVAEARETLDAARTSALAAGAEIRALRKTAERANEGLEAELAAAGETLDGHMHQFEYRQSADGKEMVLLGHDISVRRTPIGMPFRLIHNGQEVGAYDETQEAMARGCALAILDLHKPEDLSNAPMIDLSGLGDGPGARDREGR